MLARDSWYIGHLGPIPLYIHWTFLILVFVIVQNNGGFTGNPERVLIVLTVLLTGVVLHELGHGLVAKALGAMGVTITLWAFGGLCASTRDQLPRREMAILAAGPAVSFGLAYGAYALLLWLADQHHSLVENPYGG